MKKLFYLFLLTLGLSSLIAACGSTAPIETPEVAGPAFVLFYTDN